LQFLGEYIRDIEQVLASRAARSVADVPAASRRAGRDGGEDRRLRADLVAVIVEVQGRHVRNIAKPISEDRRVLVLTLAVQVLDRCLAATPELHDYGAPLAVACLSIASKQEDVELCEVLELVEFSQKQVTLRQVLDAEIEVLNTLSFELALPTAHTFLHYELAKMGWAESSARFKKAEVVLEAGVCEGLLSALHPADAAKQVLRAMERLDGTPAACDAWLFPTGQEGAGEGETWQFPGERDCDDALEKAARQLFEAKVAQASSEADSDEE